MATRSRLLVPFALIALCLAAPAAHANGLMQLVGIVALICALIWFFPLILLGFAFLAKGIGLLVGLLSQGASRGSRRRPPGL